MFIIQPMNFSNPTDSAGPAVAGAGRIGGQEAAGKLI